MARAVFFSRFFTFCDLITQYLGIILYVSDYDFPNGMSKMTGARKFALLSRFEKEHPYGFKRMLNLVGGSEQQSESISISRLG